MIDAGILDGDLVLVKEQKSAINGDIIVALLEENENVLPEEQKKALSAQIPMGDLGKPSDIANAVAFLASEGAGYITGHELHVNGGMYM